MADQWDEAVVKLIDLTESGELVWKAEELGGQRDRTHRCLGPAYITEFNGKRIAVYEEQSEAWVDHLERICPLPSSVVVEFVNDKNELEWQWPGPESRWQLLDSIRYQHSNGEQWVRNLLSSAS